MPGLMPDRILVVEHNLTRRTLLEAVLSGGAEVVATVDSGEAALVRLGMTDFACIIIGSPVEIDFAGETSTLLELFDRMAPNLASRIIVITHPEVTAVIRRARDLQVFAVFLDPFDAAELREAVRRCIRGEVPPRWLYGAPETLARMAAF